MAHGEVFMVTSYKGGVGKSTVAANLAVSLAKAGHKTLLVDCDFGVRCLDLMLDPGDPSLFDIYDLACGRASADRAVTEDKNCPGLYVCFAPYQYEDGALTPLAFRDALRGAMEHFGCEFAVLDTPGAFTEPTKLAAFAADLALIVTTEQPAAIRAAERTALAVRDLGVLHRKLILNGVDLYHRQESLQEFLSQLIDTTATPLLGILPYDVYLPRAQKEAQVDRLPYDKDTVRAFSNMVKRLEGHNVPLFSGFAHLNRKLVLKEKRSRKG